MRVRRLQSRDQAPWEELFRAYIAFYAAQIPDAVIAATWQRLSSEADGMVGFVAVDGAHRVVGIANILFHRSTWSPTWYCYLEDLYVDPGVRGQGAGRALIEAVYAEADRRGATRTYWATNTLNVPARSLYDGLATLAPFVQYRR